MVHVSILIRSVWLQGITTRWHHKINCGDWFRLELIKVVEPLRSLRDMCIGSELFALTSLELERFCF